MKKIVLCSLFICFCLSFYLSIMETKNEEIVSFATLESEIAHPFVVPDTLSFSNQKELLTILKKAANDTNTNIIRGARHYTTSQTIEYIKYVWMTERSRIFDDYSVKEDRLPELKESDVKLTLKRKSSLNQDFSIQSLEKSFEVLPASGRFFVEAQTPEQVDNFLKVLSLEINNYLNENQSEIQISVNDLQPEIAFNQQDSELLVLLELSEIKTIQRIILGVTLLFLVFYFYNVSKKIGVFFLHGYSYIRIWWELIGRATLYTLFSMILLSALSLIIIGLPISFLWYMTSQLLFICSFFIAVSLISLWFNMKNNISHSIKQQKKYNGILIFNQIFKVVATVLILILSVETYSQMQLIREKEGKLNHISAANSNWSSLENYGVMQAYLGYTTAFTFEELEEQLGNQDRELEDMYPVFNDRGAIYVDTSEYEEEMQEINANFSGIFSMTVNPNYLNTFPLQDEFDKKVVIDEANDEWILLVPENFKPEEKEIKEYFLEDRDYYLGTNDEVSLRIIWLKRDQYVFSANPEVSPGNQNLIYNPVIHVKTIGNNLFTYRGGVKGEGLSDPLKIQISDESGVNHIEKIKSEIISSGLKNSSDIISIKQLLSNEVASLKKELKDFGWIFIALIATAVYTSIFNIIIIVNSFARKFAIYRLFGAGIFITYKPVFISIFLCSIFSIIFTLLLANLAGILPKPFFSLNHNPILTILLIILIIDILVAIITLYIIEKKKIANTVKVDS